MELGRTGEDGSPWGEDRTELSPWPRPSTDPTPHQASSLTPHPQGAGSTAPPPLVWVGTPTVTLDQHPPLGGLRACVTWQPPSSYSICLYVCLSVGAARSNHLTQDKVAPSRPPSGRWVEVYGERGCGLGGEMMKVTMLLPAFINSANVKGQTEGTEDVWC